MFISKEEQKLSAEFLNKGYLVKNIRDTNSLSKIYEIVEKYCIKELLESNLEEFNLFDKFVSKGLLKKKKNVKKRNIRE